MRIWTKLFFISLFPLYWFFAFYFPGGILVICLLDTIGRLASWNKPANIAEYTKKNMPLRMDILLYTSSTLLLVAGAYRFAGDPIMWTYLAAIPCIVLSATLDIRHRNHILTKL